MMIDQTCRSVEEGRVRHEQDHGRSQLDTADDLYLLSEELAAVF